MPDFDPCKDCAEHKMMKDRWDRVKDSLPRVTFFLLFVPAIALSLGYTTLVSSESKERHNEQGEQIRQVNQKLEDIKKQNAKMDRTLHELKIMQKFYLRQKGIDAEKVIEDGKNGN